MVLNVYFWVITLFCSINEISYTEEYYNSACFNFVTAIFQLVFESCDP